MENLNDVSLNDFEFNFGLLTANGKSLRFSLDGFELQYFLRITKLIDTFGGELTAPDFPGTIVFSNPKQTSKLSCKLYHVKFIYDSIVAQKLQNLKNYRIRSRADQGPPIPPAKRCRRDNKDKNSTCRVVTLEDEGESSSSDEFDSQMRPQMARDGENSKTSCSPSTSGYNNWSNSDPIIENMQSQTYGGKNYTRNPFFIGSRPVELSREHLIDMNSTTQQLPESENRTIQPSSSKNPSQVVEENNDRNTLFEDEIMPMVITVDAQIPETSQEITECYTIESSDEDSDTNVEEQDVLQSTEENEMSYDVEATESATDDDYILRVSPSYTGSEEGRTSNTSHRTESFRRTLYSGEDENRVFQYLVENEVFLQGDKELDDQQALRDTRLRRQTSPSHSPPILEQSADITDDNLSGQSKQPSLQHTDSDYESQDEVTGFVGFEPETSPKINQLKLNKLRHSQSGGNDSRMNRDSEDLNYAEAEESTSELPSPIVYSRNQLNKDCAKAKRKLQETATEKKRISHHYTEEENRLMIQYIIDQKAFDRMTSQKTWAEFLKKEVLNDPKPTAKAVQDHFTVYVRSNYRKYTDDPVALREFDARHVLRLSGFKDRRQSYSEEENRHMIQFLIKNNAIHQASLMATWERFIKQKTLVGKMQRSAHALVLHFRRILIGRYREYTNDPTAMKKFEKMYQSMRSNQSSSLNHKRKTSNTITGKKSENRHTKKQKIRNRNYSSEENVMSDSYEEN